MVTRIFDFGDLLIDDKYFCHMNNYIPKGKSLKVSAGSIQLFRRSCGHMILRLTYLVQVTDRGYYTLASLKITILTNKN